MFYYVINQYPKAPTNIDAIILNFVFEIKSIKSLSLSIIWSFVVYSTGAPTPSTSLLQNGQTQIVLLTQYPNNTNIKANFRLKSMSIISRRINARCWDDSGSGVRLHVWQEGISDWGNGDYLIFFLF